MYYVYCILVLYKRSGDGAYHTGVMSPGILAPRVKVLELMEAEMSPARRKRAWFRDVSPRAASAVPLWTLVQSESCLSYYCTYLPTT